MDFSHIEGGFSAMSEHPLNRNPVSPLEGLANICNSFWDEELTETEVDKERVERAKAVVQAAIAETLAAGGAAPQAPPATNAGPSPKRAAETTDQRWRRWPSEPPPRPQGSGS